MDVYCPCCDFHDVNITATREPRGRIQPITSLHHLTFSLFFGMSNKSKVQQIHLRPCWKKSWKDIVLLLRKKSVKSVNGRKVDSLRWGEGVGGERGGGGEERM